MVRPASHRISRVRRYSRYAHHPHAPAVAYGTLTRSGRPFQRRSADVRSLRRGVGRPLRATRSTPATAAPTGSYAAGVWAPPRSLAATRGILSFPRGTEMFQFPRCPPAIAAVPGYHPRRVAPFGDPRITGCQRLPGAFRRVAASFIGRRRQGIHRAPIFAVIPTLPMPRVRARAHVSATDTPAHLLRRTRCPAHPRLPATRWPPSLLRRGARGRRASAPRPRPRGRPPARLVVKVRPMLRRASRRSPVVRRRWSRGGSNPEPPPCKGGALPAKLRPPAVADDACPAPFPRAGWARLDSNQGPRPYQGRALTSLSYAPGARRVAPCRLAPVDAGDVPKTERAPRPQHRRAATQLRRVRRARALPPERSRRAARRPCRPLDPPHGGRPGLGARRPASPAAA